MMSRGQMENDIPLYYFKVDEKTGKISRIKITEYERGNWGNSKIYYRWKGISCTMYAYSTDIDRFKDWHVYTFNPDYEHAYEIIITALHEKLAAAEKTYRRFNNVVVKVELANEESNNRGEDKTKA